MSNWGDGWGSGGGGYNGGYQGDRAGPGGYGYPPQGYGQP